MAADQFMHEVTRALSLEDLAERVEQIAGPGAVAGVLHHMAKAVLIDLIPAARALLRDAAKPRNERMFQ
jgi:hypothetical protein